jgi:hypothetical protein
MEAQRRDGQVVLPAEVADFDEVHQTADVLLHLVKAAQAVQLGKELLDRARNKKYKDWFDAWNDNSQENYNHIVELATNLIGYLRCKETVEGNVYSYSYKDSVFFRVDLDEGMVDFPVCNAVIKEIADEKHMDNPLLGFACGFMTVDRYIYGPAQGMYNMFYAFSRGYMVSQYPETREWIKVK